jgi:hypothetical protein
MDWGIDRKEIDFPTREEKTVETFDLKKFVSEEKRRQMMDNNEPVNEGLLQGLPDFNPFAMPRFNPLMNQNNDINNFNKPISSLSNEDIDKMIADIDKKLKELDEEEEANNKVSEDKVVLPKLEDETNNDSNKVVKTDDKPKINVDADSIIMNDNVITDDEFFDDFFGEE